jgi:hypothetical protein
MKIIYQICCLLAIALTLSGCVKYDTEINFSSLNYGEIIQHIQLDRQISSFGQTAVAEWLKTVEQRTQKLDGRLSYPSNQELEVKIPFNNAKDLESKLNQYFNPGANPEGIKSQLKVTQNNFLFAVRTHLTYDLDLQSLALKTRNPKLAIDDKANLDINFSISSPWGVSSRDRDGIIAGKFDPNRDRLSWKLPAGQIDKIDAIFWLPNPLGIGGAIVICIGTLGYYLKYRQFPGVEN